MLLQTALAASLQGGWGRMRVTAAVLFLASCTMSCSWPRAGIGVQQLCAAAAPSAVRAGVLGYQGSCSLTAGEANSLIAVGRLINNAAGSEAGSPGGAAALMLSSAVQVVPDQFSRRSCSKLLTLNISQWEELQKSQL